MFEIQKRHSPVFALSEIKKISHAFAKTIKLYEINAAAKGIEVLDIAQTARINENNLHTVKSELSKEAALAELNTVTSLQQLKKDKAVLMKSTLQELVSALSIDAYINTGEGTVAEWVGEMLPKATKHSQNPLSVFTGGHIRYDGAGADWDGMDHPALWVGENWVSAMDGIEAFFAVSPQFKLEVGFNRYEPLESFGDFAVGMIRF